MSLARTLMNNDYCGDSTLINPAKYSANVGASVIAMESIEELHEIFLEEYNYEQADLAAMNEGIALEGSQYEAVAEVAVGGVFAKVKQFFQKLWEKVKAFFHSVMRFFDSLFKSGKDFVSKYKKDIDNLSSLTDLTMKIHKFNDKLIDEYASKDDAVTDMTEVTKNVNAAIAKIKSKLPGGNDPIFNDQLMDFYDKIADDFAKEYDSDKYIARTAKNNCTDMDDYRELIKKKMLNDDVDGSDEEITVAMVKEMAVTLSKTKDNFKSLQSKSDNAFKAMLKTIDDAEKAFDDDKFSKIKPQVSKMFSAASSYFSVAQNMKNTEISIAKAMYQKRDAEYKHVIVTALSKGNKKK